METVHREPTTNNHRLLSPLRYPGSKRRLAAYVCQALELNSLQPSLYVEPFFGGGSVGIYLLQNEMAEKVIIMDLDPWVASFWHSVFFDTKWLVDRVMKTEITLDLWRQLKKSKPKSRREKAWACLYLNRTSFSGILEKKAGPLGGKDQKSEYKIDCRFPREVIAKRIEEIGKFRGKIHAVWNCSWKDGIGKIKLEQRKKNLPKKNVFYYLDPPFFEKAENLYRYYFDKKDHEQLRDNLLQLQDKWLLSYDFSREVDRLYGDAIENKTNGTNHHHVDIYYSLAVLSERRVAKEVILSNLPKLPAQETGG